MGILHKTYFFLKKKRNSNLKYKKKLLKYLDELKCLESRLWGVTIKNLSLSQEILLEDTNHLIYLINNKREEEIRNILGKKEIEEFVEGIRKIRQDFILLKKKIEEKNKLKNLITNYTILLVEKQNYKTMENIFLLEKQLYEVINRQEEEFQKIFKEKLMPFNLDSELKSKKFLEILKRVRKTLAGHLDHHELWESDMYGYSNTSNIINSLIREINEIM